MEAGRTARMLARVSSPRSRLVELTRRDAIRRALLVSGSLAVAPSLIAACGGTSDEAALGGADSSNGTAPTVAPTGSQPTNTEPTSAEAGTAEPAATAATTATASAEVPGGGSLTVDFTFAPSGDGRILVQTRTPDHPALLAAVGADPDRLVRAELPLRRTLGLPPTTAMALVSGEAAEAFVEALGEPLGVRIQGPVDGAWRLVAPDHRVLCDALATVPRPPGRLRLEVDPLRA